MKLKGVLDFSLGNFLCLRGFAPMGDLYDLSEPDPGFQRDLLVEHEAEMLTFLRDGEFLFFPEVILATLLTPEGDWSEESVWVVGMPREAAQQIAQDFAQTAYLFAEPDGILELVFPAL